MSDKTTLIEDLYVCKGQFMSLQGYSFNGVDDIILVERKTILKFIDDIIAELKAQPCGHPATGGECRKCEGEVGGKR